MGIGVFMANMKKLKVALSIIFSVLFVTLAILHVVFPQVSIDSTFIILIFIALIPWSVPYIKALEISGIGKVELIDRETKEKMQENMQNLSLEIVGANNLPAQGLNRSLDDIVQSDPKLALVALRIELEKTLDEDYNHKIRVVHIEGQFFFGSATQLIAQFDERWGTKYRILNYDVLDTLDISAIFAFEDIVLRLKDQRIKILLVIHNEKLHEQLEKHNIIKQIGEHHVFYSELDAIDFAKNSLKKKSKKGKQF